MKKSTQKMILQNGDCNCPVPFMHIYNISLEVMKEYNFSSMHIWMWKMFQFGYAYGKGRK